MKSATAKKLSLLVFLSILLGIYIPFFFSYLSMLNFFRLIDPKYLLCIYHRWRRWFVFCQVVRVYRKKTANKIRFDFIFHPHRLCIDVYMGSIQIYRRPQKYFGLPFIFLVLDLIKYCNHDFLENTNTYFFDLSENKKYNSLSA